jgi:hypothetical protein
VTDQRPPSKNPWFAMNPYQRAIGLVLVVVGGVWFLQGIGVAKGSVMTGSTLWGILGAICFVAGVLTLRWKPRPKGEDAPVSPPSAVEVPPGEPTAGPPAPPPEAP